MNWRWLAMIAMVLIVASGCGPGRRRSDAYQELLNAEKRWLEDQLYKLDYEYGALKEKHDSTLRENAALREALEEAREDEPNGRRDFEPGFRPEPDGDITPPEIDLGDPTAPPATGLPPITPPSELEQDLPSEEVPDGVPAPLPDGAPAHHGLGDPQVTHIHLNPLLTGGADFDQKPGDDGISVVIEPRNAAEKYLPIAGPLSLVVLDPAKQGEAARVGRWVFTFHETGEMLSRSVFGLGIDLQLLWTSERAANVR
ncbi:MAG: hypothetical protein KY475_19205, partial [Planctomycetes bacterium]|nr:hypothetical protein [Planctomycetota bacterium]